MPYLGRRLQDEATGASLEAAKPAAVTTPLPDGSRRAIKALFVKHLSSNYILRSHYRRQGKHQLDRAGMRQTGKVHGGCFSLWGYPQILAAGRDAQSSGWKG